jgi:hypothetical protein
MSKYLPFEIGIKFRTVVSGMKPLRWNDRGMIGDFVIPHAPKILFG